MEQSGPLSFQKHKTRCHFWIQSENSVTHPPTLDNLLLQVGGCYDQHADGLGEAEEEDKSTE